MFYLGVHSRISWIELIDELFVKIKKKDLFPDVPSFRATSSSILHILTPQLTLKFAKKKRVWSLFALTIQKLKKEYPVPFIRPCVKNRKRRIQAFSFLGSGKDLHKILRRYESVKYIFIWTFHLKLPDFWRKFFVCFVESHFIFYYNRIAFNAPLKSSSRCFCKRRIPLFKRSWN